jgi:hypothetical protein
MRRHSLLGRYAPFLEPARFARVVGPAHLIAARLQPSYCNWPQGWLDLVFSRDGEIVLVPFVQIDPPMISVRESSPLIWPAWLPFEEPAMMALEELIEPWLLSHALLAGMSQEQIGYFTEDPALRAQFDAARAARFLCAAPANDVFLDASPYIYAQRFAKSRRIGIASPDAAYGASMLAASAASVHADLGDARRNELACAWYGLGIYGELPRAAFDVSMGASPRNDATIAIGWDAMDATATQVSVARPLFSSVACSFDTQDGPEARRFGVRARDPILRPNRLARAPVIGGSQGRILVVLRDNALTVPDADTDQARALVDALNTQGFDAKLTVATGARAENVDLIHLFGHRHVHQFSYVLDEAKRLDVPVVTTPLFDDFGHEAMWGSNAIRTMLTGVRDDLAQEQIELGLVQRRLLVGHGIERGKPAYDAGLVARLFQESRAAIFASGEEEARVRSQYPFRGATRTVTCVPQPPIEPEPIGAVSGLDEYVLVHGVVDPRGNQMLAVRAAAEIGVPCVLIATVAEVDYYYALLGAAGSEFICLPEDRLSPGQIEALYAGARVYADLGWAGHGAARIARAAAHGALPVLATALPYSELWAELTGGVDAASNASAASVLRQAWMRAPAVSHQVGQRTAELCDPLRSLQAVLGAYAEAAGLKSAPA